MEVEREPIPIQLQRPELEIAWRGLLCSVEAGYLTKEDATETLKKWDMGKDSDTIIDHHNTGL